jgi:predicted small metal-binding protein
MGAMNTCSCGWTIVSPLGAEDVKKHTMIHLKDAHPGTVMTPDEIMAHIKQI